MPKRAFIIALVAASSMAAGIAPVHAAAPSNEPGAASTSRALVNDDRSRNGRGTLASSARLNDIAREHSMDMARDGELRHHPNLPGAVGPYQSLAENVGYGPSAEDIHAGFMGSTDHRVNILGRSFTQIGVGAVRDEHGTLWITQIFFEPRRAGGGSSDDAGSGGASNDDDGASTTVSQGSTADAPRVRAQSTQVRTVKVDARSARARRPGRDTSQPRTLSMLDALSEVALAPAAPVAEAPAPQPTPSRFFV